MFELAANTLTFDRSRIAIPGKAFDADLSDIAAKTAVAFEQGRCALARADAIAAASPPAPEPTTKTSAR